MQINNFQGELTDILAEEEAIISNDFVRVSYCRVTPIIFIMILFLQRNAHKENANREPIREMGSTAEKGNKTEQ